MSVSSNLVVVERENRKHVKTRERRPKTLKGIIKRYKRDLKEKAFRSGWGCWYIEGSDKPIHWTLNSKNRWQYDLRRYKLGRPIAHRVPFLLEPGYDQPNTYIVKQQCEDKECLKPSHQFLVHK
jgi:hypothetical protein